MYERVTADTTEDFVVFLLGMRVRRWRSVGAWGSVLRAMPRMLAELSANPEIGMVRGYSGWMFGGPATVQYWKSVDHLIAYARDTDAAHLPAWRRFNRVTSSTDAVGIWHETYAVRAGQWEVIHGGMPPVGAVGAFGARPLSSGATARSRLSGGR